MLLLSCPALSITAQVSQYQEVQITQPEVWRVGEDEVHVLGTVVTGAALLAVHAVVDHKPTQGAADEALARRISMYAIENGYLANAIAYNSLGTEFRVRDDVVGVALISRMDLAGGALSGARFAFPLTELYGENPPMAPLSTPLSLTRSEMQHLTERLQSIFDGRRFEDLFTLYSPEALDDFDVEQARNRARVQYGPAAEISLKHDWTIVYIGSRSGIAAYHAYIPMSVVPVADPDQEIDMHLRLMIVDEPDEYGIYNIEFNFRDYEQFRLFFGDGDGVEFLVPSTR